MFFMILQLEKLQGLNPEVSSIYFTFLYTVDLESPETILARCLISLEELENKFWKNLANLEQTCFLNGTKFSAKQFSTK